MGTVFDVVQASKKAADRAAWTRSALEKGYKVGPPNAGEMDAFLRVLEGDAVAYEEVYRPARVPERPFKLAGEDERDALVRINEAMKKRREAQGVKKGAQPVVIGGPPD